MTTILLCFNITMYSSLYKVDPDTISRIIMVESSGNPNAISPDKSSLGLMQLQFPTAKDMGLKGGKKELFNPDVNLRLGIKYFRLLQKRYNGNTRLSLYAYNRGLLYADQVKHNRYIKSRYADKVLSTKLICN